MPRSRLPLPPVPACRPAHQRRPVPRRARAGAAGRRPGDGVSIASAPIERSARTPGNSAAPVLPRPARAWADDEPALVSTGPGLMAGGARPSAPRPASAPAEHARRHALAGVRRLDQALALQRAPRPGLLRRGLRPIGLRMPAAPATTAIPERPVRRGRRARDRAAADSADPRLGSTTRRSPVLRSTAPIDRAGSTCRPAPSGTGPRPGHRSRRGRPRRDARRAAGGRHGSPEGGEAHRRRRRRPRRARGRRRGAQAAPGASRASSR